MFGARIALSIFIISIFSHLLKAQETCQNKWAWYVHWGYNRSRYQATDLRINGGQEFDFTLINVQAHDDPEPFSTDAYLNPTKFTIPQFNFRAGVSLNSKWYFSGGWDHLKYVVADHQTAQIRGKISPNPSRYYQNQWAGQYDGQATDLPFTLLRMEHTDGLNYLHINIDRAFTLISLRNQKLKIEALAGFGTGPVCPWTDTRLFGEFYRNPSIHFAGWGVSLNATTRITLYGRWFLENMYRIGHLKLWDIMILRDKYSAETKINYFEHNISIGYIHPINTRKNVINKPNEP